METGHDEPKTFDIILLLFLRGRRIVTGYEPITFAPKKSYPNKNQDYCEKDEPPNHINLLSTIWMNQRGIGFNGIAEAPEYPKRLIPSYWSIAHFPQPLTILEQARVEYLQGHKQARFFRSIDVQNPMYPDSS